jgi:hypothetical protein
MKIKILLLVICTKWILKFKKRHKITKIIITDFHKKELCVLNCCKSSADQPGSAEHCLITSALNCCSVRPYPWNGVSISGLQCVDMRRESL